MSDEVNLGAVERVIRVVLGIVIFSQLFIGGSPLALIGLVPLVSGVLGFCPIYFFAGWSTAKKTPLKHAEADHDAIDPTHTRLA